MKIRSILFLLIASLMMGTTFIIKEDGVEVGRYSEADGSDRTEIIDSDAPKQTPPPEVPLPDAGIQAGEKKAETETKSGWTMMGSVIDVVRLKSISSGTIVFSSGEVNIQAPIGWNGSFSVKVPKNEAGYMVSAILKDGKRAKAFLGESGAFKNIAYAERLKLQSTTQLQTPLKNHSMNLEIGLYPEKLTAQEQQDLKYVMQQAKPGS